MRKLLFLIPFSVFLMAGQISAQEDPEDEFIHRDFQFTFMFPPIGTNGIDFYKVVNCVSINSFIGVSAGNECFEAGGFMNVNRAYTIGTQLAGFMNITGIEKGRGYYSEGVQMAGFGNIFNTSYTGINIAGFANVSSGKFEGVQISGFTNVLPKVTNSVQIAGFGNVSRELDSTFQIAGFANISEQGIKNSQISGFFNASEDIDGMQIAGFANVAGTVKGFQLAGFVNVCDSIDGVPLAFISIVKKNGYRSFELSTSDFSYVQLSYKMGIPRLYTIYSLSKPTGPFSRWTYGGGLGTRFPLENEFALNLELSANQVFWINEKQAEYFIETDRLNMVNQVKAIFSRKVMNDASVFLAPTFNVGISSDKENGRNLGKDIMPYWQISPVNSGRTRVRLWVGFNAGLNI